MSEIRKIVCAENFRDRDTHVLIKAGTEIAADEDRLYLLQKQGVQYTFVDQEDEHSNADEKENETESKEQNDNVEDDAELSFTHTGGTWYEFSDGEKVQGKENAEKRLKEKLGEE